MDKVVAEEPYNVIRPRATTPTVAYATVSGNGSHRVSEVASGFASFETLGTVEYIVELGYQVNVSNGAMTGISNISFNIPYISVGGTWGSISFPSYCYATNAGVTANYVITKTVNVPVIGDVSIGVKAENVNEIFSLLTNLA